MGRDMSRKRPRVSWKLECVDKTFLEACIDEITCNGREGGSLKPISWKVVAEKLKKEHTFEVTQKQMKNRFDYLRFKYAAWLILKNKKGNVYNPTTNTFNLSEEEWQDESKLNKYVDKLRYAPLPYPDLCTKLFEGVTSTDFKSWGPSSTQPHPTSEFHEHDFDVVEAVPCNQIENPTLKELVSVIEECSSQSKKKGKKPKDKDDGGNSVDSKMPDPTSEFSEHEFDVVEAIPCTQIENPTSKELVSVIEECSSQSKKKGKKRKDKDDGGNTMDAKIIEVGEEISKIAKMLIEKNTLDNDMDACMEKLEKMEWGDDERYNTALLLFTESADVRKVWLRLKPSSCEAWVKNLGRKHGYDI